MSESNTKAGCLPTLIGLWLLIYIIYTPVYFLILNDEVDEFQEATFSDIFSGPINMRIEADARYEKLFEGYEKALKETETRAKREKGLDLGMTLEKVISKNDHIRNVEYSTQPARDGYIWVNLTCQLDGVGNVTLTALVKERGFIKVNFAKFIAVMHASKNGMPINEPITFIAEHFYGIRGQELAALRRLQNQISGY